MAQKEIMEQQDIKKNDVTSAFSRSYIQAAYNQHWSYGSGKEDNPPCDVPGFKNCKMKLLRHISFVDCLIIKPPRRAVRGRPARWNVEGQDLPNAPEEKP